MSRNDVGGVVIIDLKMCPAEGPYTERGTQYQGSRFQTLDAWVNDVAVPGIVYHGICLGMSHRAYHGPTASSSAKQTRPEPSLRSGTMIDQKKSRQRTMEKGA
ncbi:hypothetical protein VTN00DRAFT_7141 [Thermoascus crustaceus]|uniref:uncharacterized protein n=1 Tax=Thermoascus crustaceus TaxID=5088 RepID=UPI0037424C62